MKVVGKFSRLMSPNKSPKKLNFDLGNLSPDAKFKSEAEVKRMKKEDLVQYNELLKEKYLRNKAMLRQVGGPGASSTAARPPNPLQRNDVQNGPATDDEMMKIALSKSKLTKLEEDQAKQRKRDQILAQARFLKNEAKALKRGASVSMKKSRKTGDDGSDDGQEESDGSDSSDGDEEDESDDSDESTDSSDESDDSSSESSESSRSRGRKRRRKYRSEGRRRSSRKSSRGKKNKKKKKEKKHKKRTRKDKEEEEDL